ncbi:MAG: trigger factor [Spirochaetia bacterium]|jgi:trigger factor|nr:trigger factor [Spirochaetia bacterium]
MIAETKIKETENSSVELSITLTADSVEQAYQTKLTKYAKELTINGFRKGKVPHSIIERKYGESIRNEATFDEIENGMKEAIEALDETKKPLPFSQPELLDEEKLLPFKANSDLTFTVKYDVSPKPEIKGYTDGKYGYDTAEVSEADIDAKVEDYRQKDAMIMSRSNGDEAKADDIATIDYAEIDDKGEKIEGTAREDYTFTIGKGTAPFELTEDVAGMKMGETKEIEKTFPADYSDKDLAGTSKKLTVTLKELKYNDIPEVDDEFAQDIKEEYKTVADLRAGIKGELETQIEQIVKNEKIKAVLDKMTEENTIDLPQSMINAQVEQQLNSYFQRMGATSQQISQMFTKEQLKGFADEIRPQAIKDLKASLILETIAKNEKLDATDEEINKVIADEQLDTSKYQKNQLDYLKQQLKFEVENDKAANFILEHNTFTEEAKKSLAELTAPKKAPEEETEEAKETSEAE